MPKPEVAYHETGSHPHDPNGNLFDVKDGGCECEQVKPLLRKPKWKTKLPYLNVTVRSNAVRPFSPSGRQVGRMSARSLCYMRRRCLLRHDPNQASLDLVNNPISVVVQETAIF